MKINIGSYYIISKNNKSRCVKILNITPMDFCFCECICCEKNKKFVAYVATSHSASNSKYTWAIKEELQPEFVNNMLRESKLERITK